MKKVLGIIVITLGLFCATLTDKAQANYFEAGASFGKTKTYKTTSKHQSYKHTKIYSKSKKGYVKGYIGDTNKQDLKGFYKGELKPMLYGGVAKSYYDYNPTQQRPSRVYGHQRYSDSGYYPQPQTPMPPTMPRMPSFIF